MKAVINYIVCTLALFVAVVLLLSGSFVWCAVGLAWCGMLFASSFVWPNAWAKYWRINAKIVAYFSCI